MVLQLLTAFIQQAVVPTYSDSGIESMATNVSLHTCIHLALFIDIIIDMM